MKHTTRHILILLCLLPVVLFAGPTHADLGDILSNFFGGGSGGGDSGTCIYNGDVRDSFKNCNPSEGLTSKANVNLDVQKRSDFRDTVATLTRRIQVLASILAIGALVFVGFLLVAPVKEETKTSAKKGFMYATVGFLLAIVASIIVNAIVDLMYDIFG